MVQTEIQDTMETIFTKVRVVAVGGGGGSTPYRAGGGSGRVTGEPQLDTRHLAAVFGTILSYENFRQMASTSVTEFKQ